MIGFIEADHAPVFPLILPTTTNRSAFCTRRFRRWSPRIVSVSHSF